MRTDHCTPAARRGPRGTLARLASAATLGLAAFLIAAEPVSAASIFSYRPDASAITPDGDTLSLYLIEAPANTAFTLDVHLFEGIVSLPGDGNDVAANSLIASDNGLFGYGFQVERLNGPTLLNGAVASNGAFDGTSNGQAFNASGSADLLKVYDSIDFNSTATSGVFAPVDSPDGITGARSIYLGSIELLVGEAGSSTTFRLGAVRDGVGRAEGFNTITFDSSYDLDDSTNNGSVPPVPYLETFTGSFEVRAVAVPEPVSAVGGVALVSLVALRRTHR